MTIPAGKEIGSYTLDIEYAEQPVIPIQDVDATTCTDARSIAYDARNSQIYYIQQIENSGAGGKDLCWMESNLRYQGDGNWDFSWGYPDDRYATTTSNTTVAANDDVYPLTTASNGTARRFNPAGGSIDYTNTAAVGGFYGYLYNWCAAMGGQAIACQASPTVVDSSISICPAGWRLPTGYDMLLLIEFMRESRTVPLLVLPQENSGTKMAESIIRGADTFIIDVDELTDSIKNSKDIIDRICKLTPHNRKALGILTHREIFMLVEYRLVFVRDHEIALSKSEFEILQLFLSHAGRVFTHEQLYMIAYGEDVDSDITANAVRCHINRIRQRLRIEPDPENYIDSVRSVGYRIAL